MMPLLIAAFIMGSIGSVHCIGMCGPIALALPVVSGNQSSKFIGTMLYNGGRIITYALLGGLFGLIGMSFAIFGYQQWLSVLLGVLILTFIFLPKKNYTKRNIIIRFFEKLRQQVADLFSRKNYQSVFFIGLLNGLLPCGLIYMAIAAAISTGSVLKSSLFMAGFGLGTLPVMWSMAFFGSYINMRMRTGIKKLYPYIMFFMAMLLIIRGLGLQIPYLSPATLQQNSTAQQVIECHN
ncbi:MAG: sulfite exporter TauE/SafE family protein [Ferruginibacter sp.]